MDSKRSRRRGGDGGNNAGSVLAELFAWTAERLRPQVVDGGDVAPEEGDEGEWDDGHWGRSLHRRLGFGAQEEQLPQEREGEGERINAPTARA